MVSLYVSDEGDKNTIDRFLSIFLNLRIVAGWGRVYRFIGSGKGDEGAVQGWRPFSFQAILAPLQTTTMSGSIPHNTSHHHKNNILSLYLKALFSPEEFNQDKKIQPH